MMIYFMVNDLGYSACERGRYPAPLCARLDVFAESIRAGLESAGLSFALLDVLS